MRIGSTTMFISSHLISGIRIRIGDVPFVTRSVPMSRLRHGDTPCDRGTLFKTEGTSLKCMNAQHYID